MYQRKTSMSTHMSNCQIKMAVKWFFKLIELWIRKKHTRRSQKLRQQMIKNAFYKIGLQFPAVLITKKI